MQIPMAVQPTPVHKNEPRGEGSMKEQQYDATYKFGKTIVHVVSPGELSEEEFEKRSHDVHMAGWSIIDELLEKGKDV